MKLNNITKAIKVFSIFAIFASFAIVYSLQFHKNRPNVILIILDALRADHLGCYGYKRNTSPNIDEFASEGQLFSNAFSQAGYTFASVPSIFTSKTPFSHGVRCPELGQKLSDNETTLAEILKYNGYTTVAFTGEGYTSHVFGFMQGFDSCTGVADIENTNREVFEWLEKNKKRPFFLFIHTYTTHEPFNPPEPFDKEFASSYQGYLKDKSLDMPLFNKLNQETKESKVFLNREDLDYIISQYDGNIKYCDKHIGKLFDRIKKLKLSLNTIIILTADHGEDLMDHNTISHDDIYDAGIHIPLIFIYPKKIPNNKKIDTPVRSIDIMPTILDILKLPIKRDIEGITLLPLLLGKNDKKERLIFSAGGFLKENTRIALRTQNWKLIYTFANNAYELYNLKDDPKELKNLIDIEKGNFQSLKIKLEKYLNSRKPSVTYSDGLIDEHTKKSLRSLGYMQ